MEYYSALKRNTFESVLMRWMNRGPIIQSEVSQKEKDKYLGNNSTEFFRYNYEHNLKLQYFGHLMRRVDSLEKAL